MAQVSLVFEELQLDQHTGIQGSGLLKGGWLCSGSGGRLGAGQSGTPVEITKLTS